MHTYVQTREVIPRPKVLLTSYDNARKLLREVIGNTSTDHKVFQLGLSRHTNLGAFDIQFCTGPHKFSRYIHFLDIQRNVSTQALEETVHSMEEWIKSDTLKAWEQLCLSFLETIQMLPIIMHNVPRIYFHNVNSTVLLFQGKILLDINPCRVMAVIWKEAQLDIDPSNHLFMECVHMGEQVESVQIAFFDSEVAPLLSSCYSHNKTHYEKETLYYNPDATRI